MIDFDHILQELAKKRPVFHSEADFQHALAWEIYSSDNDYSIRLEYPFQHDQGIFYVDILLFNKFEKIVLELKYKTRKLDKVIENERFILQNQVAQDLGRYDFIKDVHRIEKLVFDNVASRGYSLFLTNDSAYWKLPNKSETIDKEFRIHEGKVLTGICSWGDNASAGTKKTREESLHILGKYINNWKSYSFVKSGTWGEFKYNLLETNRK